MCDVRERCERRKHRRHEQRRIHLPKAAAAAAAAASSSSSNNSSIPGGRSWQESARVKLGVAADDEENRFVENREKEPSHI
jgi:hypothetical protein